MSIEHTEHTGLDGRTEPWWWGPQLRMVLVDDQAVAEVDAAGSTSGPVAQDPVEVAGCYARQVDELAALVEAALDAEDTDFLAQVAALRMRHQRRMGALRVLADSLGETHGALDELAHQLRPTTPAGPPSGTRPGARSGAAAPASARVAATVSPLVRGGS